MRLILFDIDGTLVNTGGAGVRAMNRTLARFFGVPEALEGIALAGRTDRVIIRDALARLGREASLDDAWLVAFRASYCEVLREEMGNGAGKGRRVLPGVRALLDALAARDDVTLALLTGNFEPAAEIKLGYFDLWRYFSCGAFGDRHVDRNPLLDVARVAAASCGAADLPDERIFVIGDTPYDVACAKAGHVHAIAVATGGHSAPDLAAAGADVVLDDLSDTAHVLRVLAR